MGHSEQYEQQTNFRVRLTAFAFNHNSEIVTSGQQCDVSLINVHSSGARLQAGQCRAEEGDRLVLNLRLGAFADETENMHCSVRWAGENELMVDFDNPLTMPMVELQDELDN